ncbi:hypothetical protein AI20_22070 [Aeromonas hydrophila YL17]|nr:hypothetical protein AI20_22070 [Aeromonas hydrophila YL17]
MQTMPAPGPALSFLGGYLVVLRAAFDQMWAAALALDGKGLINGVSAYILGSPSKLLDGRGCREFRGIAG